MANLQSNIKMDFHYTLCLTRWSRLAQVGNGALKSFVADMLEVLWEKIKAIVRIHEAASSVTTKRYC